MKKLLPFLIAFIFSLTIKAQSPALSYTNLTGHDTITCLVPGLNFHASVSNYTAPLTYTWVSGSASATGTNVILNTGGIYTLTAFNTANSFSLSQTFTIIANTTSPSTTVNPVFQNITCGSAGATFTGITTSTLTNLTHAWTSPYSPAPAVNGGTVSIYNTTGPGTYTWCVTNNINGCSTCKTVTVASSSGFPLFTATSPQQFTLGCGTTSVTSIAISGVTTQPVPGGPVSYTVLPPSFTGPGYILGGAISYAANAPGQYTVIVHDNTNACETKISVSVIQNTVGPQLTASATNPILTCNVTSTQLQATSTTSNISYSWTSPTLPGPVPFDTLTVNTNGTPSNSVISTFTITVTNAITTCKSNQSLTVYQNIMPPTAVIAGPSTISCSTPTAILTNSSTSNVPPVFFPTLPVSGYMWYGPAPQLPLSNSSSYAAYTSGTYTLVALDLNNGCTSVATKTIVNTGIFPQISSPPPFDINCPATTAAIYPIITGPTTGFTYTWSAPPTATIGGANTATLTTNAPGIYTVTVTNPSTGCSSTTLISVAVCAGIKQNLADNNNNITVFPNPNNGLFNVEFLEVPQNAVLEISSSLGVLVKKQAILSEKTTINLQNEANGLYFITIIEGNKAIKVAKIVKN